MNKANAIKVTALITTSQKDTKMELVNDENTGRSLRPMAEVLKAGSDPNLYC